VHPAHDAAQHTPHLQEVPQAAGNSQGSLLLQLQLLQVYCCHLALLLLLKHRKKKKKKQPVS
jgi:hypothetical protein